MVREPDMSDTTLLEGNIYTHGSIMKGFNDVGTVKTIVIAPLRVLNWKDVLVNWDAPVWGEAIQEIVVKPEYLDDSYLLQLAKTKGLSEDQMERIKQQLHELVKQFAERENVKLTEKSYKALANMLAFIIEEAAKE